ncbi:hypothetical protein FM076_15580 [Streptomyces albus subsp. chlorinus]|nr:hypothetical protein [Streptomyces albus subsp. chlorinus]
MSAAVSGAVLAVLVLCGCSGDGAVATGGLRAAGPSRPGSAAVLAAADALARARTARVRTALETVSGATRVTIEGRGVFDLARGTGRLRVVLPPGADGARPGERRPVAELVTPGALYMRNRAGVPDDKWVRVETAGLPDGNLVTGGATDPVTAARLLRGARRTVYQGAPELDGARVWHFSGVVDIERAAAAAPPRARRQLRAAERGFFGRTVPFDAHLDARGRLRKIRYRFSFAAHAARAAQTYGAAGGPSGPSAPAPSGPASGGPATVPGTPPSAGPGAGPDAGLTVSSTTTLHSFGTVVRIPRPEPGDIWAGTIAAP